MWKLFDSLSIHQNIQVLPTNVSNLHWRLNSGEAGVEKIVIHLKNENQHLNLSMDIWYRCDVLLYFTQIRGSHWLEFLENENKKLSFLHRQLEKSLWNFNPEAVAWKAYSLLAGDMIQGRAALGCGWDIAPGDDVNEGWLLT